MIEVFALLAGALGLGYATKTNGKDADDPGTSPDNDMPDNNGGSDNGGSDSGETPIENLDTSACSQQQLNADISDITTPYEEGTQEDKFAWEGYILKIIGRGGIPNTECAVARAKKVKDTISHSQLVDIAFAKGAARIVPRLKE